MAHLKKRNGHLLRTGTPGSGHLVRACIGCDFKITGQTFLSTSVPTRTTWFAAPGSGARIHDTYRVQYADSSFSFPVFSADLVDGYELTIGSFIARQVTFHESTLSGDVSTATLTERLDLVLSLIYRTSPSAAFKFRVSSQEISYGGPSIPSIGGFPIVSTSTGTSPLPWQWGSPLIVYPDLPDMPYAPTSFPADVETSLASLGWATASISACD